MLRLHHLALASSLLLGCLPRSFDALEQAAPVTTIRARFPAEDTAVVRWALSVDADDEGRGRVLFSDGARWLGWLRLDEDGDHELETILRFERDTLTQTEEPAFTGLALVPERDIPEGLLRLAGDATHPDRIVRFRVADFSRIDPEQPAIAVPEWVIDEYPTAGGLIGPLAAVELDAGQPELFSASADGALLIWPELGTTLAELELEREALLADDPTIFAADPEQGFGVTRCAELGGPLAWAIAGGRLLAGDRPAAVILRDASVHFVAAREPAALSLVGTPELDCAAATIDLPQTAMTLLVADLERDGDDDLLVGSPGSEQVWVFLGEGEAGIALTPSFTIVPETARGGGFGTSLAIADLGGEVGRVVIVGAPATMIHGSPNVGRVHVFDLEGAPLTEFSDLEPQTDSQHGLGVHALGLPGRDELVVTGRTELRVHWEILAGDPRI
ncbi:hypothetical protein ACNOYE_33170 [Nannocystaceae bacterium ST9]